MCCKCCPSWSCPQWPDRCCLCFNKKVGTFATGVLSILGNLAILVPCIFALIQPEFWAEAYKLVEDWILNNHWDSDVTSSALRLLSMVSEHHALFLIILIAFCALHIFNSLLLVMGSLLEKRLLLIPWMIQDMLIIITITLVFIFWAFFSFFVHVLIAVLFPVVSGLLLGFWFYLWRNVKEFFHFLGEDLASHHSGTVYRKLPPPNTGRSLLGVS
eukprot:maker-scaffold348_size200312-snap-gene-0.27 protein:Tk10900 transcript:maker-scaffold348_size200312-snap-gene-0.27-mRNA-1 annotation:"GL10847"